MWIFTNHIIKRLNERQISKEEVLSIVNREVGILVVPSDRDLDADLYFGKVQLKYILLVVNNKTNTLITVRKMRANEIKAFKEAIKDEK